MKLAEPQLQLQQEQQQQLLLRKQASVQAAVSGVTAPVSRSSSEATMHSSRTSSANSLDSALAAASADGPLQPLLSPLQPSNSAAPGLRLHPSGSSPAAAAAAADAAAAASDSVSSEDAPSFLAAAAGAGSSSSSGAGMALAGGQLSATKRPDDHLLGYHHVKQWDILWTKSVYAIRAARQLQQGQIVSAIAGLNCLSMKKRMVQTLRMVSETAYLLVSERLFWYCCT
jgi:hypothetical protein